MLTDEIESSEEFTQLKSFLRALLTIPGTSREEEPAIDHIKQTISEMPHIASVDSPILGFDWKHYGCFAAYVPPGSSDPAVLVASHADIVRRPEEMIDPVFQDDPFRTIVATGIDNRLSCAIVLTLLHFAVKNNFTRPLIGFFAVKEECGGFQGSADFVSENRCPLDFDEVYVLDADFGRPNPVVAGSDELSTSAVCPTFTLFSGASYNLADFYEGDLSRMPVVGRGCVPLSQPFGLVNPSELDSLTDLVSFRNHPATHKHFLGAPVIDMHHGTSVASLNDIWDLYCRIRDHMMGKEGSNLPTLLSELVNPFAKQE